MIDPYSWRARLLPVVIAGSPALAFMIAGGVSIDAKTGVASLLVGALGLVLCGIARDAGFKLQSGLWTEWGGSPTVRRLRWRDNPQNHQALSRLHDVIEAVTGVPLPNAAAEAVDPQAADNAYTEATTVLRNRTRDTKRFNLVFSDNMEYGFRRNCLGLRPLGLVLAVLGAITSVTLCITGTRTLAKEFESWGWPGIVSVVSVVFWLVVVNPEWVRKPAETYAERLIEAADTLKQESST